MSDAIGMAAAAAIPEANLVPERDELSALESKVKLLAKEEAALSARASKAIKASEAG
eukprot:CAMPEP_0197701618 /NCGR_PEP_ID=MMETSP1338-20131121/123481_1 /TAXON_ID=43686 ORGANISM="Pelagodinium beii, Strain RCC1491" /NCGR_SAMPLE_ID=MMETSP1338 /ASSEMBLY_ACC=CAM_ASM_000754 /LENGTH=56 /DNA_ID=CAMNT_0043285335 /DNA_START=72 /DNA_END=238 /DNA_ORIENTATION=+